MSDAGDVMRSLGRPVAHAMNNAMMVLLMNLEALGRDLPAETPGGKRLERATLGAQQVRGLVAGLLALARPEEVREESGAKALEELKPLLELAIGRAGSVSLDLPRGMPNLRLARPSLDLALVALARQAKEVLGKGEALSLALDPGAGAQAYLCASLAPEGEAAEAFAALGPSEVSEGRFRLALPATSRGGLLG